jgi:hypothetical protein
MRNNTTFRVDAAFRMDGRDGPVIVGRFEPEDPFEARPPSDILGSWLVALDDPAQKVEVIGVELHSAKDCRGMMVRPDLGDAKLLGTTFRLVGSRDIGQR